MHLPSALRDPFFARHPKVELAEPPVYGSHPVLRNVAHLRLRVGASS